MEKLQDVILTESLFQFSDAFSISNFIITRIIKNIFNKNDSICRDVKTQKVCEQGRHG